MNQLLQTIRDCTHCAQHLPEGPRPIVQASPSARVLIIGQAPGSKVHKTGVPWDDPSGRLLRQWMGVSDEEFYDAKKIALVPMGFCYPGKGKTGDLPPRKECAPLWHPQLLGAMPEIKLTILIGMYAQKHILGSQAKATLTDTVKSYKNYLPQYLPLPHPSPRNRHWFQKNPWFEEIREFLPQRLDTLLH